jgi:hypothetical protein
VLRALRSPPPPTHHKTLSPSLAPSLPPSIPLLFLQFLTRRPSSSAFAVLVAKKHFRNASLPLLTPHLVNFFYIFISLSLSLSLSLSFIYIYIYIYIFLDLRLLCIAIVGFWTSDLCKTYLLFIVFNHPSRAHRNIIPVIDTEVRVHSLFHLNE